MLSSTLAYAERFASVKNPNVTEEIRKCVLACLGAGKSAAAPWRVLPRAHATRPSVVS